VLVILSRTKDRGIDIRFALDPKKDPKLVFYVFSISNWMKIEC